MISLMALWLPIVLSAVAVFIVSSIIHMVLQYHNSDYGKVADEDGVMNALRPFKIPPGDYVVPRAATMKEMSAPGYLEKQNQGPNLIMTVLPDGPRGMGGPLALWFLFSLLVGVLAAYVAHLTLPAGTEYLLVHRVTGTVAFAAYAMGALPGSIWYKKSWSSALKTMFDGLVYGLVTGGIFGWLWPAA